MIEWIKTKFVNEVSIQFCRGRPQKLSWLIVKCLMMGRDKFLSRSAVKLACIDPSHKVLSLGVRRGYGLKKIFQSIQHGNGIVFAIERSRERAKRAAEFCRLGGQLDKVQIYSGHPSILPFQSNFFDRAVHSDEFYFWLNQLACLKEIYRVLKPGALMVCTLDLEWLKHMQQRGFLQCGDPDPLNYMLNAELAGFQQIKFEYFTTKQRWPVSKMKTFQAVLMTKPELHQQPRVHHTDDDVEQAELELFEMFSRDMLLKVAKKNNPPLIKKSLIDSL